MKRRINYGKVLLVTFITILIWVWADKAQDAECEIRQAVIKPDRALAPDLWITFDGQVGFKIDLVKLRGPASRIDRIKGGLRTGAGAMEFFFAPHDMGMTEPGSYTLDICRFLRQSGQLLNLGVTATYCEPNTVEVNVSRLVERTLTVRCVRQNGVALKARTIEPATVEMPVPENWGREKLFAEVSLTDSEIEQARSAPIEKVAYVQFAPGQVRAVSSPIKVTMPPATEQLKEYTVTGATVGFVMSLNLAGKYEPVLLNPSDLAQVNILATNVAEDAYRQQPYQMLLYIQDEDAQNTSEQKKTIVYNFPDEFVQNGQIRLNQPPAVARFVLKELNLPAESSASP